MGDASRMILSEITSHRQPRFHPDRSTVAPTKARSHAVPPRSRTPLSRRLISTGSPFEATAGYSRAVADGDFCFVAGTTGYDYDTMRMPASVEEQTRNCLHTVAASLAKAGFDPADVVRAGDYILDTPRLGGIVRNKLMNKGFCDVRS
jgi:enamine deaminase RidA (YjgF/YER057c/UK114 family)